MGLVLARASAEGGADAVIHRHVWTVKEQREQLSEIEVLAGVSGGQVGHVRGYEATRPVIVTYACVRCPREKVVRV